MNGILQKRIEEAANITVQNLYDYVRQMRDPEVSKYDEGYLDAIALQGDFLFREGANYALSNQWISVEEAMPKSNENVFVMNEYGGYDYAHYDYNNKIWRMSSGGNADESDEIYSTITHWMEIPKNK